jgi:hypothetical protein
MATPLRQYRAEIQAYLAETGMDRYLQRRHLALVSLGLLSCFGLMMVQVLAMIPAQPGPWQRQIALGLGISFICSCLIVSMSEQERALKRLQVVTDDVAARVQVLSRHLFRRDGFLLALALVGHAVAWVDTLMGVRLFSSDVLLVALPLVPTAQFVWLGFEEVPTRGRLVFLYKLVALYSERSR